MSFMRRKAALVAAGALFAFQAIGIVGATSASAAGTCTYNAATDTVSIVINDNTQSNVSVDSTTGAFLMDGAACGSATNTNVASVVVLSASAVGYHDFGIDEASGDTFSPSISWVVDLTTGTNSFLYFYLNDEVDNSLTLTDDSFDLNGALGELLGIDAFYAWGGAGDDTIDGSALTTYLYAEGGDGDDSVSAGENDDTIYGDDAAATFTGDDYLWGGDGDDYVDGGMGADVIDEGAAPNGDDTLEDGGTDGVPAEDDTVDYSARTGCVIIDENLNVSGEDANCDGDLLDVGDESDAVLGFEVLMGGSGNDILVGNGSDETFVPGDGDDTIDGDGGANTLDYSTSSAGMLIDVVAGTAEGQGADEFANIANFVGSAFDDTFVVDSSSFGFFDGGDGIDTIDASSAVVDLNIDLNTAGDGVENLIGGSGDDTLTGNNLDNNIWGNDGDDTAYGEIGRDWFDLGAGNDYGEGDEGNDTFMDAPGSDTYYGDQGVDTIDFKASTEGIFADMDGGSVTNGADDEQAYYFENLFGTAFPDTILGQWANNTLKGRGGDDNITAAGGDDRVVGGAGSDLVRAGNGDDDLYGKGGPDFLYGGGGTDYANGGAGHDVCKTEIKVKC